MRGSITAIEDVANAFSGLWYREVVKRDSTYKCTTKGKDTWDNVAIVYIDCLSGLIFHSFSAIRVLDLSPLCDNFPSEVGWLQAAGVDFPR